MFFDIDGNTFDVPASYDIVNFVVSISTVFIIISLNTSYVLATLSR